MKNAFYKTLIIIFCLATTRTIYSQGVLAFEKNNGQIMDQDGNSNTDISHFFQGNGFNFHLRKTGFSYELNKSISDRENEDKSKAKPVKVVFNRVDIEFINCNYDFNVLELTSSPIKKNYYTNLGVFEQVPSYSTILYENVYDHIDIEFIIAADGTTKYNFILNEGADLSQVRLKYLGYNQIEVLNNSISIETKLGTIEDSIPFSFFENNGTKQSAQVEYVDYGNGQVGFELISGFLEGKLIIDPVPNVIWGTYNGGSGSDNGMATCFTPDLELVLSGDTYSTGIATVGAYDGVYDSGGDAFISKFAAGGELLWTTYYGGTGWEGATDVVSDLDGNIIFTGWFESGVYGASSGALQTIYGGGAWDACLVKLNPNGTRIWGTFYGSTGDDEGYGLAVNNLGEILLAGSSSSSGNVPAIATPGTHKQTNSGGYDSFLAKFSPNGERLWGTFFGGTGNETIYTKFGVDFDADGNIVMASWTQSFNGIATAGAHKASVQGQDGYLAKFNSTGNLEWATYIGGEGTDFITSVVFDVAGNILISGASTSTSGIASPDSYQNSLSAGQDGFIQKFTSDGEFLAGTYLGGASTDFCYEIDNYCNDILAFGVTQSTNFPILGDAFQSQLGGSADVFVSMLDDNLETLYWSTYYGGASAEVQYFSVIGMESASRFGGSDLAICGTTSSTNQISYGAAHSLSINGSNDAFLARLDVNHISGLIQHESDSLCEGATLELIANSNYSNFSWGDDFGQSDTIYVSPDVTTTYSLETTTTSGCVFKDSITVTVIASPDFEITVSETEICLGTSFNASVSNGFEYTWPAGMSEGNEFTPLESGTSEFLIIGENEFGCITEESFEIEVSDSPDVTALASQLSICEGDSVIFNGIGGSSYTWNNGVINNEPFYPDIGTETYVVMGNSTVLGCEKSDSIQLTVNELPEFIASISPLEICLKDSAFFSSSGNAHTYYWSGEFLNNSYYTPLELGLVNYFVTGIDVDTRCEKTLNLGLIVKELPVINIDVQTDEVCQGETMEMNASGGDSYTWSEALNSDGQINFEEPGDFFIEVIGTDSGTGCMASDSITISVFSTPLEVTASASAEELCYGEEITLTGSGASEYEWANGILNGVSFSPEEGDQTYMVIGSVGVLNCHDSAFVNVTVRALPEIDLGADLDACLDESFILDIENLSDFQSVNWTPQIETGVPFIPSQEGSQTYVATVEDEYGCFGIDEVIILVSDCDSTIIFPTGISPNNDGVNDRLIIDAKTGEPVQLQIFNEWGFLLYESSDYQNDWFGTNEKGTSFQKEKTLPIGTYYYIARIGEETYRRYIYLSY